MIYAAQDATSENLYLAQQSKTGIVLGFNEPNEANQADNTVAVCRPILQEQYWQTLMVLHEFHM